jgi:hypothetical protein
MKEIRIGRLFVDVWFVKRKTTEKNWFSVVRTDGIARSFDLVVGRLEVCMTWTKQHLGVAPSTITMTREFWVFW